MTNDEIKEIADERRNEFGRIVPVNFDRAIIARLKADMFWDAENTEHSLYAGNENDAVAQLIENAGTQPAHLPVEFRLQRAKRLPDLRITVTAIGEDGEIEYEREENHA